MSTCLACGEPLTPVTGIRVHPGCDVHPDIVTTQMFGTIEQAIIGQPRSQQTRIGPSELGVPCDRRLGYHFGAVTKTRPEEAAWKPYVGTALHEQVGNVIARHEMARFADGDPTTVTRHHVEERVSVGDVNGVEITGSCDWFDEATGFVGDWKFTTRNLIREHYRPHGPGEQYRRQAHLYGRGWQRAGYDVRHVGVIFMTRDGEFSDRHLWSEPYDEQVAIDTLERASSIARAIDLLGPDFTIPTLATASSHCNFCPWHKAGTTEIERACPGHPKETETQQSLSQLIGA